MKSVKVDNWSNFLLQRVHAMYRSGYKCDTLLRFANEPDSVCLKVHGLILASSSRFFDLLPKSRVGPYTVMTLPFGIGFGELKSIVEFLYTGQLNFNAGDPYQVYLLCQRLQVDVLIKLLSVRFKEKVHPDDLILRPEKVEFKDVFAGRASNIILESDDGSVGRGVDEEEDEFADEDEEMAEHDEFDLEADVPSLARMGNENDPFSLPSHTVKSVRVKVEREELGLSLSSSQKLSMAKKRGRLSEAVANFEKDGDDEEANARPVRITRGKGGKSVMQEIAEDWDDEGANDVDDSDEEYDGGEEPVAKRPRKGVVKPKRKGGLETHVDDSVMNQVIEKIPRLRDAAASGRNVKVFQKTVGKKELMEMQRKKNGSKEDGKRLACLVLKTVDAKKPASPKPTPSAQSMVPPPSLQTTTTSATSAPPPPRHCDWECNLCRDIDRPYKFASLQQLKSHYSGTHDMTISVMCKVCGQDAPRRLLSTIASFVTYTSVMPNPETHIRCFSCRYVVVMKAKRTAKIRDASPEPTVEQPAVKPDKAKPLQCKECKLTFRSAYNLSMHQKARHPRTAASHAHEAGEGSSALRMGGIPLDQVALKGPDGTLIPLATGIDGQPIIVTDAEIKDQKILGEYTYVPDGVEMATDGDEQYIYVSVDFENTDGLVSEDGAPLQCFTVGENGELVAIGEADAASEPEAIVAQPVPEEEAAASGISMDGNSVLLSLSEPGQSVPKTKDEEFEEPFEKEAPEELVETLTASEQVIDEPAAEIAVDESSVA